MARLPKDTLLPDWVLQNRLSGQQNRQQFLRFIVGKRNGSVIHKNIKGTKVRMLIAGLPWAGSFVSASSALPDNSFFILSSFFCVYW
jgi:hypothetical protein